jgi:hypothetical protein
LTAEGGGASVVLTVAFIVVIHDAASQLRNVFSWPEADMEERERTRGMVIGGD